MIKPKLKISLYFFILIFTLTISNTFSQSLKSEIDSVNNMPYHRIVSNLQTNMKIFKKNLKKAEIINYKYGIAKTLMNLSLVYYLKGNYDENTKYVLRAIKIFEESNFLKDLAESYGVFGFQLKRRNITKAKKYMQMGINIAEKYNLLLPLSTLYDNYGVVLVIANSIDSAIYFYDKSLQINHALNNLVGIPFNLNHLADVNTLKGNYKTALKYLKQSDKYRAKEEGDYGRAENLVLYADLYYSMGNYEFAFKKYNEGLTLAKKISNNYMISYCYDYLTKISVKTKNYKEAYEYFKLFSAYKDSLINVETNSKIAQLEIDYETEKKDKQIVQNMLQIRKRNSQLIAASGLIIFLILLSYLVYRIQKLKRERVKREFVLNNKLKQAEYEKKIIDEKLRVSRDLHDNIGSNLTFLISSMDNLSYSGKYSNIKDKLNNLSSYGRETLSELRNTIWAMKTEGGNIKKLVLKITELKQNLGNQISDINIELDDEIQNDFALSSSQMLNIYRIVQEAVQNIVKYAEASLIKISFKEIPTGFVVTIEDDGIGFDLNAAKDGNGLDNMCFRCEESGGQFKINSSDKGTIISCIFNTK